MIPKHTGITDKQNLLYLIKQSNNHQVKSIENLNQLPVHSQPMYDMSSMFLDN